MNTLMCQSHKDFVFQVWQYLKSMYPNAIEYSNDSEPCPICTLEEKEKSDALSLRMKQRLQEKKENFILYKMLPPIQDTSLGKVSFFIFSSMKDYKN